MQRHPSFLVRPTRSWPGLRMLALLLLAGLLWSWAQARASGLPSASGELGYFMTTEAELESAWTGALVADADQLCRPPAPLTSTPVEQVLNEVGDLEVLFRRPVWMPLAQAAPEQLAQPPLQEAELRPLLRPPARLG